MVGLSCGCSERLLIGDFPFRLCRAMYNTLWCISGTKFLISILFGISFLTNNTTFLITPVRWLLCVFLTKMVTFY
jgi:hypothetical protein